VSCWAAADGGAGAAGGRIAAAGPIIAADPIAAAGPMAPRGLIAPLALSLAALACANIQPPPGGPPDTEPPELVGTFPESLAVLPGFHGAVEFRFNEVVSEGSQPSQGLGTGDLERLVILSPTTQVPEVRWHRRRISVRPAEGWQPNRVYRVELLPGVADVRQNRGKAEAVITFTTGAPPPRDTLSGRVYDWRAGRPAAGALVEAVLEPDSLPYRGLADSSGSFRLGPLPRGDYLVYGVIDENKNRQRDPREAWDTVRIAADSLRPAELYAFVHDTAPPRIASVTATDSLTATITFAQPLDPFQRLDPGAATLRRLPDSTTIPVRTLAQRDSAAPAADTTRALRRPPLSDRLTLRAGEPWHPGDRLELEIAGVRTVTGVTGTVRAPLVIERPKPGRVPSDTGRRAPAADSLRPGPGGAERSPP